MQPRHHSPRLSNSSRQCSNHLFRCWLRHRLQHPQHQQCLFSIQIFNQRVPIPFTCPDAPCRRGDLPTSFLKPRQPCLNLRTCLCIALRSSRNSSDELPMLEVDVVAVALESSKGLALTVAVISRLLCPTFQVSDYGEEAKVLPDF